MNTTTPTSSGNAGTDDILFECPQCGKSLEIDARGAGYLIVCPDCKNEVQVPAWDEAGEEIEGIQSEGTPVEAPHRVGIEDMLEQLQATVTRLEKKQAADDQCFKRLADEVILIQSALDRITEIVESRSVGN